MQLTVEVSKYTSFKFRRMYRFTRQAIRYVCPSVLLLPVEAQIAGITAESEQFAAESPGALLQLASTNNEPLFALIKRGAAAQLDISKTDLMSSFAYNCTAARQTAVCLNID